MISAALMLLSLPLLIGVVAFAVVAKRFKPYVAFLGCAIVASMAAIFFAFCGREQSTVGLCALVFFGLGAVVIPILLQGER